MLSIFRCCVISSNVHFLLHLRTYLYKYVYKCECLTEMRLFTNCEMGARYVFFSVRGLFLAVCPCDLRSGAIVTAVTHGQPRTASNQKIKMLTQSQIVCLLCSHTHVQLSVCPSVISSFIQFSFKPCTYVCMFA